MRQETYDGGRSDHSVVSEVVDDVDLEVIALSKVLESQPVCSRLCTYLVSHNERTRCLSVHHNCQAVVPIGADIGVGDCQVGDGPDRRSGGAGEGERKCDARRERMKLGGHGGTVRTKVLHVKGRKKTCAVEWRRENEGNLRRDCAPTPTSIPLLIRARCGGGGPASECSARTHRGRLPRSYTERRSVLRMRHFSRGRRIRGVGRPAAQVPHLAVDRSVG